jgi:RNA polymerase sigma factor (sigma-70 family)
MLQVQAGNEAAFGQLMHRWELPVKRFIGRLVFNIAEAEDLAQETFVRVWRHRDKFRPDATFRPWLFTIALNLARNRLRWWRLRPSISLDQWSEGEGTVAGNITAEVRPARAELETKERALAVRAAIAELPVDLREALVLSEFEQMTQAEIAATVGASRKAIESRIARAKQKLRDRLAEWWSESDEPRRVRIG